MFGEFIFHLLGIRLMDVPNWPLGAVTFAKFFMHLWASASLFVSLVLYKMSGDINLQVALSKLLGIYLIFQGALLWWWSNFPLIELWQGSSLFVWLSFYPLQLKFESLLLIGYGLYLIKSRSLNKIHP
jgi:hypothetical protein